MAHRVYAQLFIRYDLSTKIPFLEKKTKEMIWNALNLQPEVG